MTNKYYLVMAMRLNKLHCHLIANICAGLAMLLWGFHQSYSRSIAKLPEQNERAYGAQ
jgi:hypothetical protein